ncbi:hypothetical protein ACHAWU_010259 [Discostella pseudostelligera]|uniref:Uncharacterized protein n=1 Tax=Discostella pseudostelligera TaxID=259834 RepID=A0ABD3MYC8_9STRA
MLDAIVKITDDVASGLQKKIKDFGRTGLFGYVGENVEVARIELLAICSRLDEEESLQSDSVNDVIEGLSKCSHKVFSKIFSDLATARRNTLMTSVNLNGTTLEMIRTVLDEADKHYSSFTLSSQSAHTGRHDDYEHNPNGFETPSVLKAEMKRVQKGHNRQKNRNNDDGGTNTEEKEAGVTGLSAMVDACSAFEKDTANPEASAFAGHRCRARKVTGLSAFLETFGGLSPYKSDFIDYEPVKIEVKGVAGMGQVIGRGTTLRKFTTRCGAKVCIPSPNSYHMPGADIRLESPQSI